MKCPDAYRPSIASQISHELRIPLTGIFGVTNFLSKTTLTLEQQTYLQMIREAANRLLLLDSKLPTILKTEGESQSL
jgi:signal transduction histidine kinase